jgi:hypothetical protein
MRRECCIRRQRETYMKMRVWVGTARIAGKELFIPQEIKKGIRLIQYTGQRISQEETADRLHQGNQYIFAFNDRYNNR